MQAQEARKSKRRWLYVALVMAAAYLFNLAFYAGSDIGRFRWRLEHGRLLMEKADHLGGESFFVASNTEPIHFGMAGTWVNAAQWSVTLPMWIPVLVALALWIGASLRHSRQHA